MSNMSEDKKARLEAIRDAKRAQQGANGGAAPAVAAAAETSPAPEAPAPAALAQADRAAAGGDMSDDKKAKLEAIRAANAAKKATAGGAPAAAPVAAAATTPAAPAPVSKAAAVPAAAPKSAAAPAAAARSAAPAKPAQPIEDDPQPRGALLRKVIIGAVFGLILCVLFASMTGNYIQGAITGLILGAVGGPLVLSWPPQRTTGD